MICAPVAKRAGMSPVIGVDEAIGEAAEQQVQSHTDDRKKANTETEGYEFRDRRLVSVAIEPSHQGPEVNQRQNATERKMHQCFAEPFADLQTFVGRQFRR